MFDDEKFEATGKNFFLTIYAYFTKRDESVGIEILDILKYLETKYGKTNIWLSVNVIYTWDGGKRLNKPDAMNILKTEN